MSNTKKMKSSEKETKKIVRILRFFNLLMTQKPSTAVELAQMMGTTRESIYRYIGTLRDSGLAIVNDKGRFSIVVGDSTCDALPIYFSQEEARAVAACIDALHDDVCFKQPLRSKMNAIVRATNIPDCVIHDKNPGNLKQLNAAIGQHCQVVLHDYYSPSSGTIRDRRVEPFAYTTNYVDVWCFDVDAQQNKIFKIERVGSVEVLADQPWQYGHAHRKGRTDIFRMTGFARIHVKLKLGLLSRNLLLEEFPVAEDELQPLDATHWLLDTRVTSLLGVGRFVIGLADDIEIVEGEELKKYIRDFAERYLINS